MTTNNIKTIPTGHITTKSFNGNIKTTSNINNIKTITTKLGTTESIKSIKTNDIKTTNQFSRTNINNIKTDPIKTKKGTDIKNKYLKEEINKM